MLKRVSIQNFKSLKDVTLDLQKVNLLIGPNNSGKTNFLKALEFAGRLDSESNIITVPNLFGKTSANNLIMHFAFDHITPFDEKIFTNYLISPINDSSQRGDSSYSLMLNKVGDHTLKYKSKRKDIEKIDSSIYKINVLELTNDFGNITLYKPDPNKLDKPGPVGRGDSLITDDASNLIAFFDRIRDEYPDAFAQIKSDLAKCVPEFTEINFQNVESTQELVKQFGDKTFKRIGLTNGKQKTIYWADELSEGTLYFIALLCIINQPNPPKLLLLEEPEKGIHPRRIREVMNFIRRLVSEKDIQVIMTTHSPLLLDEFAESPESVFVFDKDEEGATIVRNLQRDVIDPANEKNEQLGIPPVPYTEALGEYWTIGFLGGVPHEAV